MKSLLNKINLITIIALLGWCLQGTAQEVQFSQYYNLIQYQNPAFVGTSYALRGALHSRLQWPALESRYFSTVAAVDYNLGKYNSGFGGMLIMDDQGASAIKSYRGVFQYAYLLKLSPNLHLRSGLSLGFARRILSNAALYYPDQFVGNGFSQNPETGSFVKNYVDVGTGMLLYANQFWLGFSASQLNNPNQSLIKGMDKLPARVDIIAGYKIILKSNATMRYLDSEDEDVWALYPTILYKMQGKADQLDIGIYSIYGIFKTGLWYRGLPIKNYEQNLINNEAIVALAGVKLSNFSVHYSYDFIISKLNPIAKGAHEINLTWYYPKIKNAKSKVKYKSLPCPGYYNNKLNN